ncbi:hypothetical protein G6F68_013155 [Rhizopus microsporus]|nr:hypothetical protein G6F68_013155 [Rhizopus microsporus]
MWCPRSSRSLTARIGALLADGVTADALDGRQIDVPVCYGGEHGPDLPDVARAAGVPLRPPLALVTGALFIAAAMTFTGLDRRIALVTLSKVGTSTRRILIGCIAVTIVLSLVVPSATARSAAVVPIRMGVIAAFGHLERRHPDGRRPEPADGRLNGKDAGRTRGVVGLADRRRPLVADHVGRADHRGAEDAAAGKRQHRRRQGSGRKVAA